MKLENLFALYLYQNKTLNLPGIGVFTADKVVSVPDENEKHPMPVQGITFTNKNVILPDEEFIDFIKLHTGKMKPLAISDLESYLMLSKQFLNIGKPFYLEGIGTLQKVNDGSLKFIPGEYVSTKLESPSSDKNNAEKRAKSEFAQENREYNVGNNVPKKMLILLLAIATLALIGWGGYYLFKGNTVSENGARTGIDTAAVDAAPPTENGMPPLLPDSSMVISDSTKPAVTTGSANAGTYKFILETASKKRALKRYNDLASLRSGFQLETKDSLTYNIYLIKQAPPTDTTRLKDSLNAWYYGTKEMRVKIQP